MFIEPYILSVPQAMGLGWADDICCGWYLTDESIGIANMHGYTGKIQCGTFLLMMM